MMFRAYFMLLLLGHVLGEFYSWTGKAAEKKNCWSWVFIHGVSYFGIMALVSLPVMSGAVFGGVAAASILHLFVECARFIYVSSKMRKNKMTKRKESNIFLTDQFILGLCIVGTAFWLTQSGSMLKEWDCLKKFFDVLCMEEGVFVSWALALLLIHKPANDLIQKVLAPYRPENKDEYNDKNIGRFIGTVERIIMLIFLSIGQYSAVGLVLTAKSIARYDKISKEKDFAEYYLLGTLMSTLIVIAGSFFI